MAKGLVLGHCILNMNARAPGIAVWRGVIEPVYEALKRTRKWFIQLPCPESIYLGLRRWWFVREQYDNYLYRRLNRKLALSIAEILLEHNINNVKIIGLGFSPSCAVRETQSDSTWGGRPREISVDNIVEGKGVWIEVLEHVLRERNISYKLYDIPPAIIYPRGRAEYSHRYPIEYEEALREVLRELECINCEDLVEKYPKREVTIDQRSGKIIVAPQNYILEFNEIIDSYVRQGYGIIMIPYSNSVNESKLEFLGYIIGHLLNHARIGHEVKIVYREESLLYKKFLHQVKEYVSKYFSIIEMS